MRRAALWGCDAGWGLGIIRTLQCTMSGQQHRPPLPECCEVCNLPLTTHQESLLLGTLMIQWTFFSDLIVHLQIGWWDSCHALITGVWCEFNGKNVHCPWRSAQHLCCSPGPVPSQPPACQAGTIPRRDCWGNSWQNVSQGQEGFSDMQELGLRETLTIFWAVSWHSYLLQFNCYVTAFSWK